MFESSFEMLAAGGCFSPARFQGPVVRSAAPAPVVSSKMANPNSVHRIDGSLVSDLIGFESTTKEIHAQPSQLLG
jgi:hypothetical protein